MLQVKFRAGTFETELFVVLSAGVLTIWTVGQSKIEDPHKFGRHLQSLSLASYLFLRLSDFMFKTFQTVIHKYRRLSLTFSCIQDRIFLLLGLHNTNPVCSPEIWFIHSWFRVAC